MGEAGLSAGGAGWMGQRSWCALFSVLSQASFFPDFEDKNDDVAFSFRFIEQPSDIKLGGSEFHVYQAKLSSLVNIWIYWGK